MKGGVKKRGAVWYITFELPREDGTRRRKWERAADARTKREAEQFLRTRLADLDRGSYVEPMKTTFGDYLDQWLTALRAEGAIRSSTLRDYESIVRLYLKPHLGNHPLTGLQRRHVENVFATLRAGGMGARLRRVHVVGRAACKRAVESDPPLLVRNPFPERAPRIARQRTMKTLNQEEARRLLDAIQDNPSLTWIALALSTGLRRSEVAGLNWRDVNLETGSLSIRQTLHRERGQGLVVLPTKSRGSTRSVALSPQSVTLLRAHHARQAERRLAAGPAWRDEEWVFTGYDGRPLSPDTMSHEFAKLAGRLRLPTSRLHDLRHTHASLLLAAGTHAKVVSERLGHATIGITLDTYSHVLPGLQEAAAAAFEQAVAANPVANR